MARRRERKRKILEARCRVEFLLPRLSLLLSLSFFVFAKGHCIFICHDTSIITSIIITSVLCNANKFDLCTMCIYAHHYLYCNRKHLYSPLMSASFDNIDLFNGLFLEEHSPSRKGYDRAITYSIDLNPRMT